MVEENLILQLICLRCPLLFIISFVMHGLGSSSNSNRKKSSPQRISKYQAFRFCLLRAVPTLTYFCYEWHSYLFLLVWQTHV